MRRRASRPETARGAASARLRESRRPPGGSAVRAATTSTPSFSLALLLGSLACSQAPPVDPELVRQQQRAERVTIVRDDFGVPHVYGRSDADAVFGLLYAQAEDDFPRIERNYVWAIGRLAEIDGEEALYSDLRARLYMSEEEARAAFDSAPPWLQELCEAWADGLDYYLHSHPEVEPALIDDFEPWMPMYFFEGSIGGDIEQIPVDGIEAFYAPLAEGAAPAEAPREVVATVRSAVEASVDREPRGSNGIAIAGELTASGDAMLLINPHTSFYFRGEVHAESDEGLGVYGAVTWGQFFVYQGFNEHGGWMHTSTRVDFIDEFALETRELDGGEVLYRYGDEWRPLERSEVTLRVRDGEALRELTFPIYRSHHGPITHRLGDGHGELSGRWTATRINWDPVNALRQSYLRTKTTGLDEFREVMRIRTNSSNNTVFADAAGNIAYFHGNFVPRRDPALDYQRPVDGSDPATDWQGLHTLEEIVSVVNPPDGWLQNANSTPFTAAGEDSPSPDDYPVYMAPDAENHRGLHAVRLLEQLEERGGLTLDGLIELAYHPALPAFERLVPAVVDAWRSSGGGAGPHRELAEPVAELASWDHTVSVDSVAMSLAHFLGEHLLEATRRPDAPHGVERIEELATAEPDLLVEGLAAAVARLERDFGSWRTPWGEINRLQRLDGAIDQRFDDERESLAVGMASGRWGALASFGAESEDTRRLYGTSGNSFVAVVEFGEQVRARSLLAGGQSGDPESPHFMDQAQLYVDADFKPVAFYRDDVERRAVRTYRPGE
ncbi:MAG: acylase [Acidobacteria bacterium]|nr:MAG: acylase [Acidobacteriota bacterium]REK05376.1 MAG: acylase [Acidobacteriota bacterium]